MNEANTGSLERRVFPLITRGKICPKVPLDDIQGFCARAGYIVELAEEPQSRWAIRATTDSESGNFVYWDSDGRICRREVFMALKGKWLWHVGAAHDIDYDPDGRVVGIQEYVRRAGKTELEPL